MSDKEQARAALSATQPAQAAQSEPGSLQGLADFLRAQATHPIGPANQSTLRGWANAVELMAAQAQQVAGEVVAIPREWRKALQKLAFMAETSGGTAGADAGLKAAIEVAKDLLARPYLYTTPPTQPAPVVPEALRKWHDAYGRYLHWNGEYNRKHALAEELKVPFPGPDLNTEFQAFTSAQNEAYRLQGPLHDAITAMLAAAPTPPAQAAQALSYSDVVEREMMEMSDAALATHQQRQDGGEG